MYVHGSEERPKQAARGNKLDSLEEKEEREEVVRLGGEFYMTGI